MSAIAETPLYATVSPVARRLGVSAGLLHKYARQGLINPLRTTGGTMLFTEDDIAALARLREERARARQRHREPAAVSRVMIQPRDPGAACATCISRA